MGTEKKIEVLRSAAERKRQDALNRTNEAINRLIKQGKQITFPSVAEEAGVSVTYLYKYDELRERINHLRSQQKQTVKKPTAPQPASEKSKTNIVQNLRQEINKLRSENRGLRDQVEMVYGRLHSLRSAEQEAEALKAEFTKFQAEINSLKKQLEECRQTAPSQTMSIAAADSKVASLDQKRTKRSDISDEIKSKLSEVGIQLNSTLSKTLRAASEDVVLAAIEALKQAMEQGKVKSPGGWLKSAIEDGWTKNEPQPQYTSTYNPPVYKAPEESEEELISPSQIQKLCQGLNNERTT